MTSSYSATLNYNAMLTTTEDEQNQYLLSNSTSATPSNASTDAWTSSYSTTLYQSATTAEDDTLVIALSVAIPSFVVLLIIAIVVSVILLKKRKRGRRAATQSKPEDSIHSESVEYYNIDAIDVKNENIYMNKDTTQKNSIKHSPRSSSEWIQSKSSNNFDKMDRSASRESPKIGGSPYPLQEEDFYESTLPRDPDSIYANQDIIETYRSDAKPKK
ncbi:hypothetical protein AOXY_G15032 [Acipenser oxyrinchus oxyrinchus]|uniref:Uncharacterized protein n=1 Tax=Acipenser oxyrinchus oxyrinchus TaxID=40147 RepID=A0AAD8D6W6_ACIOX|nr:hypothetical protein AOXY_G15032 [Acipenser oxyrinchus oxyrinchus]